MADAAADVTVADPDDLGLPAWLNDMLKPGVGAGVFTTLKLSLVGLVLTLCLLLVYITDEVRLENAREGQKYGVCLTVPTRVRTYLTAFADRAPTSRNLPHHGVRPPCACHLVYRRAPEGATKDRREGRG